MFMKVIMRTMRIDDKHNPKSYGDNTLHGLDISWLISRASLRLYPNGQPETTLFGCWGPDHEDMENGKVYKGQVIW